MASEEVMRWLRLAEDDLKSAQVNLDNQQYYVRVFLSHQGAEKALKAALIKKTGKFLKIHDLVFLGEKVEVPPAILEKCDRLNGVYIDTRYGDTGGKLPSEKFNKVVALEFLNMSKEVVIWSKNNILNT